MSQLIQTGPYITAMARQTPTRGQDPSRRHFWMAPLIIHIVVVTIACYWCSRVNLDLIRCCCSLSLESFYNSDNDIHSMIGGFTVKGEKGLTSINLTRWTRHETAEYRCPLRNIVFSSFNTCGMLKKRTFCLLRRHEDI